MLVGRRSNEEASVARRQSRFLITSCAVVTLGRNGWADDRYQATGLKKKKTQLMFAQTLRVWVSGEERMRFYLLPSALLSPFLFPSCHQMLYAATNRLHLRVSMQI